MGIETILCYLFIYIVEAFILWQYCTHMFPRKHSSWMEYIIITVLYIIPFFATFKESLWINLTIFSLVNFIYIGVIFQTRWYTALFHSVVSTILMFLCELLAIGLNSNLAYNFYEESYVFLNMVVLTVISKLLYFLIMMAIVFIFRSAKSQLPIYNFSVSILTLIPIISLYIAYSLVSLAVKHSLTSTEEYSLALCAFLLLIVNIIVFSIYNYNQKKSQEFAELQIQYQKEYDSAEYYRMLIEQHENQSILIHDIKKHLHSIALINQEGDPEAVATYINQIITAPDLQDSVRVSDNQLLNAILSRYIRLCQNKQIDFRPDIRKGCMDFVQDTDMTTLICNLLDNAVESASRYEENPYIELQISKKEKTPFTLLTMVNSCRTSPFSPDTGALVTQKKDKQHHGYGIKSIKRLVRKYDGDIEMYHSSESSTFHTIITLKNKNSQ